MGFNGWSYWLERLMAGNRKQVVQLLFACAALAAIALIAMARGGSA